MRKVWWILFLSSALAQGAELASWVRESPGYAALRAQRAEAALALEAARAGLLPTLAPQVDYAKTSLSENLSLGLGGSLAVLPWSDAQDAELAGLLCSRGCDNDSLHHTPARASERRGARRRGDPASTDAGVEPLGKSSGDIKGNSGT